MLSIHRSTSDPKQIGSAFVSMQEVRSRVRIFQFGILLIFRVYENCIDSTSVFSYSQTATVGYLPFIVCLKRTTNTYTRVFQRRGVIVEFTESGGNATSGLLMLE